MPLTVEQFCDQVVTLGLVKAPVVERLRAQVEGDGNPVQTLARILVKEKSLTAYQAQQVYAGRGKFLILGKYEILDKLGEGGMGQVLKARHRTMDRIVAIKILPAELVKSPEAVARFHREVRAAAKLEHPNIVRAYDADNDKGTHFLVMEYVPGMDLAVRVRSGGALSVAQAVDFIRQAARGLEFAHARGVVHRDIKPSNMVLDSQGVVRILDMGLARLDSPGDVTSDELTATGQVMGTVDYMAPEQATNIKQADGRADMYSLGVTLHFLLAARPMYGGDTIVSKLMAHQTAEVPSLAALRGDVPPELNRIFQRMVAKRPEDRFPTMTALVTELDRVDVVSARLAPELRTPVVAAAPGSLAGDVAAEWGAPTEHFARDMPTSDAPTKGPAAAGGTEATVALDHPAQPGDPSASGTLVISNPAAVRRRTAGRPRGTFWQRPLVVALGIAVPLLLAGIIILIKNKDGTVTRIEVPDGAEVEVVKSPDNSPVRRPTREFHDRATTPVKVRRPLVEGASLVPRPQAIVGLKSWDIVLASVAASCSDAARLPDGRVVTSWGYRPGIYIHRADDLRIEQVFLSGTNNGSRIALSQDGQQAATYVRETNAVTVVDLASGRSTSIPTPFGYDAPPLSFDRNRQRLAVASRVGLTVFTLADGQASRERTRPPDRYQRCVAWSPDQSQIWSIAGDDSMRVHRSDDLTLVADHPLAKEKAKCFALAEGDANRPARLAVVTTSGELRVYDTRDWSITGSLMLEEPGTLNNCECSWSPEGTRLAVAFNGFVEVWDVAAARRMHRVQVNTLRFVWQPKQLVCFPAGFDLKAIDLESGQPRTINIGPDATVYGIPTNVSPDATRITSCTLGDSMSDFDLETGSRIWRTAGLSCRGFRYASQQSRIALITWKNGIEIRNVDEDMAKQTTVTTLPGKNVAWSPDDRILAVLHGSGQVTLHDTKAWTILQQFKIEAGDKTGMAWSPNGRYLAVQTFPKSAVHFWDTSVEKLLSVTAFPPSDSELEKPDLQPVWQSNDRAFVLFGQRVFAVEPRKLEPVERFKSVLFVAQGSPSGRLLLQRPMKLEINDSEGKPEFEIMFLGMGLSTWLPDGRRFVLYPWAFGNQPARGYDVDARQWLGCCFPYLGKDGWLTIGPTGHYQGSPGIERSFVVVAEHLDGRQQTYAPDEFASKFNWKNDPRQATFLKPVATEEEAASP